MLGLCFPMYKAQKTDAIISRNSSSNFTMYDFSADNLNEQYYD